MGKSDRKGATQFGVLPYRQGRDGKTEVLLLTSRDTGRWVIPKGWPMAGKKPHAAAAQEALEEAGIQGNVARKPIGSYHYTKWISPAEDRLCEVVVFLMLVTVELASWPEQHERQRVWFRPGMAAALVDEGSLALMIENML
jgi:8-oxo-dGTP pyrophosphatase MutT (NUDIX family)